MLEEKQRGSLKIEKWSREISSTKTNCTSVPTDHSSRWNLFPHWFNWNLILIRMMQTHFNSNISVLENTLILKKVSTDSLQRLQFKNTSNLIQLSFHWTIARTERKRKWFKFASLEDSPRQFCGGGSPKGIDKVLNLQFTSLFWNCDTVT